MSMVWHKLGHLYEPSGSRHPNLLTHAANPLAVRLDGGLYRIFYSGRDAQQRSSVGAVDIDLDRGQIVEDFKQPFLSYGPEGSFYADGVSIGNCYATAEQSYILFMGWQVRGLPHWRGEIGRLRLEHDFTLTFDHGSQDRSTAFMGLDETDPISLSYPWVEPRSTGGFEMWYGSTRAWGAGNGEMLHVFHHATSEDGHHWARHGLHVPYVVGTAQAFSRPTVCGGEAGFQEMWFSYRGAPGKTYRIGSAKRARGGHWVLALDETGLDVSQQGWDSEMLAYPFVFRHRDRQFMLYNGNGYGRTGFGLAVREAQA
jgi:hypothetical protein